MFTYFYWLHCLPDWLSCACGPTSVGSSRFYQGEGGRAGTGVTLPRVTIYDGSWGFQFCCQDPRLLCASGEPNGGTANTFLWSPSQLITSAAAGLIVQQFLSIVEMAKASVIKLYGIDSLSQSWGLAWSCSSQWSCWKVWGGVVAMACKAGCVTTSSYPLLLTQLPLTALWLLLVSLPL